MTRRTAPARRLLIPAALLIAIGAEIVLVLEPARGPGQVVHGRPPAPAPVAGADGPPALAIYSERSPHVDSTLNAYALQGSVRGAGSAPAATLPPLAAGAFRAPIGAYRRYAERTLQRMSGAVGHLRRALTLGDRAAARSAWRRAFADYLALGAVYLDPGRAAALDERIDGNPGGLPGGMTSPRFSGLHRLERGLWTGERLPRLTLWAQRLAADVKRLRRAVPSLAVSPLDYATRSHEILEDAARDLLSGVDVPWSGEGVLGTDAGLVATSEIVRTLTPALGQREGVLSVVDADLHGLRSTFAAIRRDHDGQLPTNPGLSRRESERLDGALGQALEGLAQIPGALETGPLPTIPAVPAASGR